MARLTPALPAIFGAGHRAIRRWSLLCLFLVGLALAGPAPAQAPEVAATVPLSRFQRTVNYLQAAPVASQADFAAVALAELAAVYMAEADLARSQAAAQTGSGRARLLGWSIAVDQYADELLLVLDDVEQGFPVSLRAGQQGPPTITVADRTVILGHPRADQQGAFEQRVLTDFCDSHDCAGMVEPTARAEPIPMSAARVNPLWTFAEGGSVCSNDGLEVYFPTGGDIAVLRSLCEELAQETATLANAISRQIRHGVAIDWSGLVIAPTPGRPEHMVRLNAAGDSVLLAAPLLYSSPSLVADIASWLRDRVSGKEAASVRLDAAKYGWLAPPP